VDAPRRELQLQSSTFPGFAASNSKTEPFSGKGEAMKPWSRIFTLATTMMLVFLGTGGPAHGKTPGPNGQIAFAGFSHTLGDSVTYRVNPDGSNQQQLFFGAPSGFPNWSPDGTKVSIGTACADGTETCAATIVDVDSGTFVQFKWPDPTLETDCGVWSPDGARLACLGLGVTDPSRNGIYTIRSSDGRGLTRITSNRGGEDDPGDFSPDGNRMVFARSNEDGPVGIFVVKLNGSGLRRITPPGFLVDDEPFGGRWSPTGNQILLTTRTDAEHRLAIWIVRADGSGLHKLPITPACGGAFSDPKSVSCFEPGWSPDGTKIVFTRISANGTQKNIYIVNADGSGLTRVTNTGGASQADWGTHPLGG
jgi:Tol biopolymer transport system component